VRKDGEHREVLVTLSRSEVGEHTLRVVNLQDVTEESGTGVTASDAAESVTAGAAALEGDAHVRAILDSSQNAMLLLGPDGSVEYRNQAFADLLGYEAGEFRERALPEFATTAAAEEIAALIRSVTNGDESAATARPHLRTGGDARERGTGDRAGGR
jgi:PAS domain S-box-containing protein